MIAAAIIIFRETLEAALVLSIIMAATYGVARRELWVGSGVGLGIAGALLVAAFASMITAAAEGMGQELLNASILLLAVLMLGWHTVWMAQHGREIAREVGDVGKAVAAGARPLYALAVAAGVAVMREGSETVLFLYGIASSGDNSLAEMAGGGVLGLAAGVASGVLLYRGLLSIPVRHLFSVTNAMIILLTAGLAAQAAGLLVQADLIPALGGPVWDTSAILSEKSIIGKVLHSLIGYAARPMGVQVASYVTVLGGLMLLSWLANPKGRKNGKAPAAAMIAIVTAGSLVAAPVPQARADIRLRYPNIDYSEIELETRTITTFDRGKSATELVGAVGAGLLPFLFLELEGEWEKEPGERLKLEAREIYAYLMLTEPGKYWLDFSLFLKYEQAAIKGEANAVEIGGLFQKEYLGWVNVLNLYFENQVGKNREDIDSFDYSWQTRYRLHPMFQPGIEFYGAIEDLAHPGKFNDQQFRIGPAVVGSLNIGQLGGFGKLKYEVGYLFGVTGATEDRTFRTRFEYEIPF